MQWRALGWVQSLTDLEAFLGPSGALLRRAMRWIAKRRASGEHPAQDRHGHGRGALSVNVVVGSTEATGDNDEAEAGSLLN